MTETDVILRKRAFEFLHAMTSVHGDVLPRTLLAEGLLFDGVRVPLVGPKGIFKPRLLDLPLTITTSPNSPYTDGLGKNSLLRYMYRGNDPMHSDNVGLRTLMQKGIPLIYFHGLVPGKYLAAWPVYIVDDSPGDLAFSVALDDSQHLMFDLGSRVSDISTDIETNIRRRYKTAEVRVRLHQRKFRERVIDAYRTQCAMCRLKHVELLDAAHIIPDSDDAGEPEVSNGVSLCKIHHAAFDQNIIGIRPDFVLEVRKDVLEEVDGPMLKYGLQQMHGVKLVLPNSAISRPSVDRLEERYERFSV